MPIDMARLSKPVAAQSAPPSVILVVQIFFSSLLAEPTGIEPASPTRQAGMLPLHHGSVWWSVLESDQVGPEDNGFTVRPRAVRVYRSVWWNRRDSHPDPVGANHGRSCYATAPIRL